MCITYSPQANRPAALAAIQAAGNGTSSGCVFYDVRMGDMDVDCTGANNCYAPSGTYGVLSTTTVADVAAYGAAPGLGLRHRHRHRHAFNLVKYWSSSDSR